MKKYKIYFDEEHILACDEAEIVDYLTDQNPKAKINYEFVQKFIDVFGVEVEE